ncbi:hypothetical protein ACH4OW_38805 [Streptomyces sp. NPDC017056]|uniref:hypothetical protein n=1 Tax=Streptomyces sp. NPDC017056 TaxID=3364973 RepID=UPI0037B8473C
MSARLGARAVLRVGDRVHLDDRLHTAVGLPGMTVRLLDEAGSTSLVLLSHLLTSEGFELIGHSADQGRMPPFALLDIVPARESEKAVAWERHVTEVEFGKPLDADPTALPRPVYDETRHTMEERVAARAAELQAIGWQASLGRRFSGCAVATASRG